MSDFPRLLYSGLRTASLQENQKETTPYAPFAVGPWKTKHISIRDRFLLKPTGGRKKQKATLKQMDDVLFLGKTLLSKGQAAAGAAHCATAIGGVEDGGHDDGAGDAVPRKSGAKEFSVDLHGRGSKIGTQMGPWQMEPRTKTYGPRVV